MLLTLAGAYSLYWVLFSIWMTAYPFADLHVWRIHFYVWLSATLLIAVCWTALLVWLIRRKRASKSGPGHAGRNPGLTHL